MVVQNCSHNGAETQHVPLCAHGHAEGSAVWAYKAHTQQGGGRARAVKGMRAG